jgi:hypothetical protein
VNGLSFSIGGGARSEEEHAARGLRCRPTGSFVYELPGSNRTSLADEDAGYREAEITALHFARISTVESSYRTTTLISNWTCYCVRSSRVSHVTRSFIPLPSR